MPFAEDGFTQIWTKLTGITRNDANKIVARSDRSEVFEYDGLFLQLFTKLDREARPPDVALVIATQRPGEQPALQCALKLYADFAPNTLDLEPSALLAAFLDRFGFLVDLGKESKKLYLREAVASVMGEPLRTGKPITVHSPPSVDGILELTVRFDPVAKAWKCAYCFAVDRNRYRDYLRKPGSTTH
jgi:hypothetical protein